MYLVVVFCIEQLFKMSIGAVDFSSHDREKTTLDIKCFFLHYNKHSNANQLR